MAFSLARWILILMAVFYALYLLKELIVIDLLLQTHKTKFDGFVFFKYLAVEFPAIFFMIFALSFTVANLLNFYFLWRAGLINFMSVLGLPSRKVYFRAALPFACLCVLCFFLFEFIGKKQLQAASIIFNDELIRKIELVPEYHFQGNKFIALDESRMLFFSGAVFDSPSSDFPSIYSILLWKKAKDDKGKESFIFARAGQLKKSKLKLVNARHYQYHRGKKQSEFQLHHSGSIEVELGEANVSVHKYETASPKSLGMGEMLRLISSARQFSIDLSYLYFFVFEPVFLFLLLPWLSLLAIFSKRLVRS